MVKQQRRNSFVPPGVSFLTRVLATKALPIIGGGYVAITVLEHVFDVSLSKYATWSALAASVPLVVLVRSCTYEWKKRSRAKALGASLAPVWNGRLPGNYDVLQHMLDKIENGYIGM